MVTYSITPLLPHVEVTPTPGLCPQCYAPCKAGDADFIAPLAQAYELAAGHCLACVLEELELVAAYGTDHEPYTLSLTYSLLIDTREGYL